MPKVNMDYSKTHFYKIVCKDINIPDCYVGHTTNFSKRKSYHKESCLKENNKSYNMPLYKFIRDNGGWDGFDMILIETEHCDNSLEARKKERHYIEALNASLNQKAPFRSIPERKEYKHNWYKNNFERIAEYKKQHYQDNKDHYKQYHKEHYEINKDEIKEKRKEYAIQNKSKILEQKRNHGKTPYTCVCGQQMRLDSKTKHEKTKKHQEYLTALEPVD